MIAALLPLTLSASAADTAKLHTDKVMAVPVTEKKILPVDLDQAAASQDVVLPQQPVHMTADTFFARNADGYVKSRGNVDIKQGMDEVHANYVEGNMKSGVYHTKGPVVYVNETNALTGQDVTYNSQNGSMSMDKVEGFMGPTTYIRGTDAEMYDNIGYVKHGLITTPHAVAKTPDYYITGDDIRIYPGEKFTAENTALWFKHVRLFTYGHYEGRLDNKNKTKPYIFTLLPRPTYNSDDGIGVRGYADIPLNDSGDLTFHASYALTSERHSPSRESPEHQPLRSEQPAYLGHELQLVLRLYVLYDIVYYYKVEAPSAQGFPVNEVLSEEFRVYYPLEEEPGIFYLPGREVGPRHLAAELREGQQISAFATTYFQYAARRIQSLPPGSIVKEKSSGAFCKFFEILASVLVAAHSPGNEIIPVPAPSSSWPP